MDYQFVLLQTAAELLAYHYMNDQRRTPIAQTHEQQSYIDERVINTDPLQAPVVQVSEEQIAVENRAKQEQEDAKKERDELKDFFESDDEIAKRKSRRN